MSKKENKKEERVLTIRDFKVMIEGMDMILGDDWYPTEEQWKRIRSKIDNLIVSSERPVTNTRLMYPQSNVAMPGNPIDNDLLSAFPQVPVASDIPIGEVPTPSGSALTPPAAPTPPETTMVDGEAVKVHKTGSFV